MQLPNSIFFEQVEAMLSDGQEVQIRIKGNSMRPMLHDGRDTVVLKACDGKQVKVGDVVLFRHAGHHILHRLIARNGDNYLFAGDGNYRITESATSADIIALMDCFIRPSGRIVACNSRRWRMYSSLWCSLPALVRRIILRLLRFIHR